MSRREAMSRPSILIDLERCMGCMSCRIACKMENNVPVGNNLIDVKTIGPVGTFPKNLRLYYVPHGCMQCNNPSCVTRCPTRAVVKRNDGLVTIDPELCIACGICIPDCPYNAISINTVLGTAIKCELCKQLTGNGKKPNCVKHCKAHALFFGNLNDRESDIRQHLEKNRDRVVRFLEGKGTEPTVIYLKPKCGMEDNEIEWLFQ